VSFVGGLRADTYGPDESAIARSRVPGWSLPARTRLRPRLPKSDAGQFDVELVMIATRRALGPGPWCRYGHTRRGRMDTGSSGATGPPAFLLDEAGCRIAAGWSRCV